MVIFLVMLQTVMFDHSSYERYVTSFPGNIIIFFMLPTLNYCIERHLLQSIKLDREVEEAFPQYSLHLYRERWVPLAIA